jgi:hypothetical protein
LFSKSIVEAFNAYEVSIVVIAKSQEGAFIAVEELFSDLAADTSSPCKSSGSFISFI